MTLPPPLRLLPRRGMLPAVAMVLFGASTLALAAEASFDPDQVASTSELFMELASEMGPWYEDLQNQMTRTSLALEGLDRATLLVGDRADPSLGLYAQGLRKQAAHQYLQVQRFADLLAEDSEATFGAALERALANLGVDAKPCTAQRDSMMGPMRGMGGANSCEGEDVSQQLAQRMDQDKALQAAVAEIKGLDWPSFVVEGSPQEVIFLTGTARYISLDAAAEAFIANRLDVLERELEDQLAPLEDRLKEGEEGGKEALAEAAAFRAAYEVAVAAEGDRLLSALLRGLKKEADVGVCTNPKALGGCEGTDATASLLPMLKTHNKVLKALK